MRPNLLLVDDDLELTASMQEFLSQQGFQVSAASDGLDGLHRALCGGFDLIILDVVLPGHDGIELLRRLRAVKNTPVLVLTARADAKSRVRGLESGADDYVPKPFEPLELLARIQAILRRAQPARACQAIEVSGIRLEPAGRAVRRGSDEVDITGIEYEILETLMRSAGRVVSRDELTQRLYQRAATAFERSVDVHISHLRRKLAAPADLIRTVRGVGYEFAVLRLPMRAAGNNS